jgi:hypothetical protein
MPTPSPKRRQEPELQYCLPVKLAWGGNTPVEGELTLARQSEFRSGPQTILERLNERVRVLAVVRGDNTHLINRELIDWVAPGAHVDHDLVWPLAYHATREEHVRVHMMSGGTFEGVIAVEMPEGFNRVSDFLNGDDDFFALKAGSRLVLVNKRRIRQLLVPGGAAPSLHKAA